VCFYEDEQEAMIIKDNAQRLLVPSWSTVLPSAVENIGTYSLKPGMTSNTTINFFDALNSYYQGCPNIEYHVYIHNTSLEWNGTQGVFIIANSSSSISDSLTMVFQDHDRYHGSHLVWITTLMYHTIPKYE
jgi:hypothetical protein